MTARFTSSPSIEDSIAATGDDASHLAGARLRTARARFADSLGTDAEEHRLGEIVLRPDQIETVRRVRTQLARDGGCLLADDVGSGKSYVALAVARAWSRPLLIVPASLRMTWETATRRAGVHCSVASHEALSRGAMPPGSFDGIVVDESHRFRPTSRRHAALARLCLGPPVILLSATPLQNRTRELAGQLAIFLGDVAYRMRPARLASFVIRGAPLPSSVMPKVAPPRWLEVNADDGAVLRAILDLPPPPRAADAGDGGALLALSLVRAWASSRAALTATIRRRQQTLVAIEQCHEEGRIPTRSELRSWRGGDGVQLGFASLLAEAALDAPAALELARAIALERRSLDALLDTLKPSEDPDRRRVAALVSVRAMHATASVLAFSESARTVRSYFDAMQGDAGVGMLTAREARIASGRIRRTELLALFAPRAQGARAPIDHQRVTLLLATDLLSEGVNLQDAAVVVHLDLPWNPARLAQRLGRVRRPGGAAEVFSYLMAPPADAALLLRAESRLRAKLAQAERTIGRGLDVIPVLAAQVDAGAMAGQSIGAPGAVSRPTSAAELRGEIDRRLAAWRRPERRSPGTRASPGPRALRCIVAAVRCERRGWLAALDDGRIVAAVRADDGAEHPGPEINDGSPSDEPELVARALALAERPPRPVDPVELQSANAQLGEFLAREWLVRSCGLDAIEAPNRRAIQRRLQRVVRAAPRHLRAGMLAAAAPLRATLHSPLPLGLERALMGDPANDTSTTSHDAAWLAHAERLLASGTRDVARGERPAARAVAMILLGGER